MTRLTISFLYENSTVLIICQINNAFLCLSILTVSETSELSSSNIWKGFCNFRPVVSGSDDTLLIISSLVCNSRKSSGFCKITESL